MRTCRNPHRARSGGKHKLLEHTMKPKCRLYMWLIIYNACNACFNLRGFRPPWQMSNKTRPLGAGRAASNSGLKRRDEFCLNILCVTVFFSFFVVGTYSEVFWLATAHRSESFIQRDWGSGDIRIRSTFRHETIPENSTQRLIGRPTLGGPRSE